MTARLSNPARVALALLLAAGAVGAALLTPGADAAKAKKKAPKTVTFSTGNLNTVVPEESATGVDGFVKIPIQAAGKALKGKEIADVDVNLRASGVVETLAARLTAPNGATTWLVFSGDTEGDRWGTGAASCTGSFLTIDDDTRRFLDTAPATDNDALLSPYFGRAQPGDAPLSVMDGGPAKGTWTLMMLDDDDALGLGTLHCAQAVVKLRNRVP